MLGVKYIFYKAGIRFNCWWWLRLGKKDRNEYRRERCFLNANHISIFFLFYFLNCKVISYLPSTFFALYQGILKLLKNKKNSNQKKKQNKTTKS